MGNRDRWTRSVETAADIPLLDEADAIINGMLMRYQHIVVDEAQDLSPMRLRALARRSNGSMTVVGDIAQSSGPWARDDARTMTSLSMPLWLIGKSYRSHIRQLRYSCHPISCR